MTLKEQINADFMTAFKAKDIKRTNLLGVLKGEIQNEEGRGSIATDEVVLVILKKMEKSLLQTNTSESLEELEFIKPYLPKMMGVSEIEEIIVYYHTDLGLLSVGDMMKEFNANYKGKADNKVVSSVINKILS
jgi:uncharacterized protein YqeY